MVRDGEIIHGRVYRFQEKIALYVPSLRGGGAERVVINLARGFTEKGVKVDLVVSKAEGPLLSKVPLNVRLVDLGSRRVLYSLPALVRYLRKERPAIILSTMHHANILALWAKVISKVKTKTIVTIHNNTSRSKENSRRLGDKISPVLCRYFYPWADAVVAVSRGVADDLMEITGLSPDGVHVIYNPVVSSEIYEKAEEVLDHPWFKPGTPPVILGVGRLTREKDFPTLIRAFAVVSGKMRARLMILGEGRDRHRLELLIRELGLEKNVSLPGFVDNPYKYMMRAKVFVLSSQWEGLPTVLIEAMTCGTSVVSTDCQNGPREILENGKWGYLVPVGDEKTMAEAIKKALAGDVSKDFPVDSYTLENATNRYLGVLGFLEGR